MTESDRIKEAMLDAVEEWAEKVGDHLLAEAVKEAPLLGGGLRGSGRRVVVRTATGVHVRVHFDEPYARRQHEATTVGEYLAMGDNKVYGRRVEVSAERAAQPVSHAHGKAHYLEDPLKSNADRYVLLLAASQRRATSRFT